MNTDQKMNGCISISNIENKNNCLFSLPKTTPTAACCNIHPCIRRLRIASQYLFKQRYRYTLNVFVY